MEFLITFLIVLIIFLIYHIYNLRTNDNSDQLYDIAIKRLIHDIKTPLATLLMAVRNIEYILAENEFPEEIQADLNDIIQAASESVLDMEEKTATLSVLRNNSIKKFTETDVTEIIEKALAAFQKQFRTDVILIKNYHPDLPLIHINSQAMIIALKRLIQFGLDSINNNGTIKIMVINNENNDAHIGIKFDMNIIPGLHGFRKQNSSVQGILEEDVNLIIAGKIIKNHKSSLEISPQGRLDNGIQISFLVQNKE